jgi:RNA polymerase sigma-70 factor (ECF subfamily)
MTTQSDTVDHQPATRADMPEHELVRLAKSGDDVAFAELMARTKEVCLRVATCMLGNSEDARDELQASFWLAYSRLELFTYQSRFSTWLVRIVINRCLMRLRVRRRMPVCSNEVLSRNGEWYVCDAVTHETPEFYLGQQEVITMVQQELRRMPPLLRQPIQMHYIDQQPVKDVAKELGLTIAAAKSRLHRGHAYLRERMLKHVARRGPCTLTA